jgi:peroxiredoxin Q/BCP
MQKTGGHCPHQVYLFSSLSSAIALPGFFNNNGIVNSLDTHMNLNQAIPDFEIPATGDKQFKLSQHSSKLLVIYFYPKDSTPGCTSEGQLFRDMFAEFEAAGAEIFGISRDSVKSHENFKAKYGFPFDLLADTEEIACSLFGVIKLKNMYGKQVRGIERSTFVIEHGLLRREWRAVKVDGHATEVLEYVKSLGKTAAHG